jgi:hypothetical protein
MPMKNTKMTLQVRKNIVALRKSTKKYTPVVSQRLAKDGAPRNRAVVSSAAKYYEAILRLAES